MRTVLLSLLIATTVFLKIATAGPGAAAEKKLLTPAEIFRDGVVGQARVEFTVKAVAGQGFPFSMEEAVGRQPVMNADGKSSVSRLVVVVSEKVETRLHQLGIEDLRTHFYKKTVRVTGNLKQDVDAGGIGNRLITYTLTIDDLDQLEFVGSEATKNAAPAGAAGDTKVPGPGPGPVTPRT